MKNRIIVLGATGYTGRLICEKLSELKVNFSIGSRKIDSLNEIKGKNSFVEECIVFDTSNSSHFEELKKFDYIVNCIGPFNIFSKPIIEYLSTFTCTYIDITGEQDFVQNSILNFEQPNRSHNSLFCHSCSFESALVGLMARFICNDSEEYKSINSFYEFSGGGPSPGTRFTMKTHHYFNQYRVLSYDLTKIDSKSSVPNRDFSNNKSDKNIGLFTPFPEVLFIGNSFNVSEVGSYTLMTNADAEMALRLRSRAKNDLDKDIQKLSKSKFQGPLEEDRKTQGFTIYVESVQSSGEVNLLELKGTDMYQLTANLVCAALEFLIKENCDVTGVKCISQFVPESFFIEFIKENNLALTKNEQALIF